MTPLLGGQETTFQRPDGTKVVQPAQQPGVAPAAGEPAKDAGTDAPPQELSPEALGAKRLFEDASRVMQEAKAVSYTAEVDAGDGLLAMATPKSTFQVRAKRASAADKGTQGWVMRIHGTCAPRNAQDPPYAFDAAWIDNGQVEALDQEKRTLFEKPERGFNMYALQSAKTARLADAFSTAPFAPQLAAREFVAEGQRELDGVPCDVVLVTSANGRTKTRWAISTTDHFPRLIEQVMDSSALKGSIKATFTGVQVSQELPADEAAYRVVMPEGFAESRMRVPTPASPAPEGTDKARPDERKLDPNSPLAPAAPTKEPGDNAKLKSKGGIVKGAGNGKGGALGNPKVNDEGSQPIARPQPQPATPNPSPAPTPAPTPLPTGPIQAPAFSLTPVGGGDAVTLESLAGSPVIVTFGGSWCVSCPGWLNTLHRVLKEKVDAPPKVLVLAVRERDPQNALTLTAGLPDDAKARTVLLAGGDQAFAEFGAKLPGATYLIDGQGKIIESAGDLFDEAAATKLAEALKAMK